MIKNFIISLFTVLLVSCQPVYTAKNYKEIANSHKTIAILPPKVIIEIKDVKNAQIVKEQEKLESDRFQKALTDYINEKQSKGIFFVTVQNVEETNKILAENGIINLTNESYKELAQILNVDGVVSSRVSLAKPMTNAEAFFTSMLTGWSADSRLSSVDMSITDKNTGKMFWNYNWISGSIFTSTERLTNDLMKNAIRNFPYKVDKQ